MRSGCSFLAWFTAEMASPAKTASWPTAFSLMASSRRMSWSSSTMRILAMALGRLCTIGSESFVSQVLQDPLEAGREAASRGAWPEAYELLIAADKHGTTLTGGDLELLSHAAMWTGHLTASIEYAERAYGRYSDGNEMEKAAMVALALAAEYRNKLQVSASQGWHQRAVRLLESMEESPAHGFLALQRSMMASGRGDYDEALEHIRKALDVATRHHDRDLLAQATLREGVARVNRGD